MTAEVGARIAAFNPPLDQPVNDLAVCLDLGFRNEILDGQKAVFTEERPLPVCDVGAHGRPHATHHFDTNSIGFVPRTDGGDKPVRADGTAPVSQATPQPREANQGEDATGTPRPVKDMAGSVLRGRPMRPGFGIIGSIETTPRRSGCFAGDRWSVYTSLE